MDAIKETALYINESKRAVDELEALQHIADKFGVDGEEKFSTLVQSNRRIVKESIVNKYTTGKWVNSTNERKLYVMSDLLLWCTKDGKYRGHMHYTDDITINNIQLNGKKDKMKEAIKIIQEKTGRELIFVWPTANERNTWSRLLCNTLEKYLEDKVKGENADATESSPFDTSRHDSLGSEMSLSRNDNDTMNGHLNHNRYESQFSVDNVVMEEEYQNDNENHTNISSIEDDEPIHEEYQEDHAHEYTHDNENDKEFGIADHLQADAATSSALGTHENVSV
jgi:hypothetical protein